MRVETVCNVNDELARRAPQRRILGPEPQNGAATPGPDTAGGADLTSLADRVSLAFAPGGALAAGAPGLQHRQGQVQMAVAVAEAIDSAACLVAEGGTGVGKTLAYLVPLLLSGRRAILSTSTHLLQHQLAQRDIPALSRAMGLPIRAAVLKGRSHYLCNHWLALVLQTDAALPGGDPRALAELSMLRQWSVETRTGDFSELWTEDTRSAWRGQLGSTRETCLGSNCPSFQACHFRQSRLRAADADWVVVNHHLFLSEMLSEQEAAASWLVDRQTVVFDEAHRLPDISREMLGQSVGQHQLLRFANDLARLGPFEARGLQPWAYLAMRLQRAVLALPATVPTGERTASRSPWLDGAPAGVDRPRWLQAISELDQSLAVIWQALQTTAVASINLRHLLGELEQLARDWRALLAEAEAGPPTSAHWMQWEAEQGAEPGWRLVRAPAHVEQGLAQWMRGQARADTSWILTSATLGSDDELSWFTRQLGLHASDRVRTGRYASPFHERPQMALHVPLDLPQPADPAHSLELADRIADWAALLGGRTLVLTTTVKAARRIAHRLRWRFSADPRSALTVLDETQASREALLKQFRQAATAQDAAAAPSQPDLAGAVLVASMAFWEGIDLVGDVLQLLVIDKLPFPRPDDPMVQARSRWCEYAGQNAFQQVFLPEAELSMRQGVGRLIRSIHDEGVVIIADDRLVLKSYGPQLMRSLPNHRRLEDENELALELQRLKLTRSSTRGRSVS